MAEEIKNVPVVVYAEMTPNPATMKFVANKALLLQDDSVEFESMQEAKGYSPIAEALFEFPFVSSVFITGNFISITKTDNVDWDFIVMEMREFVKDWLTSGKEILIRMPQKEMPTEEVENKTKLVFEPSEYDGEISALLNEYVRPAVENDGGAIDFVGYKDGVVTVELRGACAGCPSSTATLKGGIEHLLSSNIDAVKEVVALSA